MAGRAPIETAPARGRYDRALSRQARQAEQRARLVAWIAAVYRERGEAITVHDVVQAAGVGRNTFYEYFDGLEHALDYAAQTHAKHVHEVLVNALATARTPIAKLRELGRAWFDEIERDPGRAALLLRQPAGSRSAASGVFAAVLAVTLKEGRNYGEANVELLLVEYAAFAAEGGARSLLTQTATALALQDGLGTLLTRVFR